MKDYRGNYSGVIPLLGVTLKQFAEKYMEISQSPDKVPKASTLFPTVTQGRSEMLYEAVIYYDTIQDIPAKKDYAGPDTAPPKKAFVME